MKYLKIFTITVIFLSLISCKKKDPDPKLNMDGVSWSFGLKTRIDENSELNFNSFFSIDGFKISAQNENDQLEIESYCNPNITSYCYVNTDQSQNDRVNFKFSRKNTTYKGISGYLKIDSISKNRAFGNFYIDMINTKDTSKTPDTYTITGKIKNIPVTYPN